MVMIDYPYQEVSEPPSSIELVSLDVTNYSPSMVLWCMNNITKYWCYCINWQKTECIGVYTFHFESEEDRAMFILKWT